MPAGRPVSYSPEQQSRWIEMAKSGLSTNKISACEGVSWDVVSRALKIAGEFKRTYRGKLTDEQRAEIKRRNAIGETIVALAAEFGVHKRAVWELLNVRGTPAASNGRKWGAAMGESREDAFDEITPESAYWIGYMMCDGGIYTGVGATNGRITVVQGECHEAHLERLKAFVGSSNKLLYGTHVDPNGTVQKHLKLQFTSPRIQHALEHYGIIGLKPTRVIRDEALMDNPCFWRGCMDADGTVYDSSIKLAGHAPLLSQWEHFVTDECQGDTPTVREQPGCLVAYSYGETSRFICHRLYGKGRTGSNSPSLPDKKAKADAQGKWYAEQEEAHQKANPGG